MEKKMRQRHTIDVKSLIIGVLIVIVIFVIAKTKNRGNVNFDIVTAKKVSVVTPQGNSVINLSSENKKAFIEIFNEKGKRVAILAIVGGDGRLYLSTKEGEI
jgi:biopolymer transport protein ExbD